MGKVKYYLDGEEIGERWGVRVSGSKGLLGRPGKKSPLRVSYADRCGECVDLTRVRYEPREITLECFADGGSRDEVASRVGGFLAALDGAGTHRLEVGLGGGKSLFFEVYRDGAAYAVPNWGTSRDAASVQVKLIEPQPTKKVYSLGADAAGREVGFVLSATDEVTVHWGDGSSDIVRGGGVLRHAFGETVGHVLVAGEVRDAELTSTETEVALIYEEV